MRYPCEWVKDVTKLVGPPENPRVRVRWSMGLRMINPKGESIGHHLL